MLAENQAHALISCLYHSLQHVSDEAVTPVLNAVQDLYQWSQEPRKKVLAKVRVRNGDSRITKPLSIRLNLRVREPYNTLQNEKLDQFSLNATTQSPNEKNLERDTPKEQRLSNASTQSPTPHPRNMTISRNMATRTSENTTLTAIESRGSEDMTCALGSPTPKRKPIPREAQKPSRTRSDLGSFRSWCISERDDIIASGENRQARPSTEHENISTSIGGNPGPPKKRKRSRSVSASDDDVIRSIPPSPVASLNPEKKKEKCLSPKPRNRTSKRPRQQPIAETFSSQEKLSSVRSRLQSQNNIPDTLNGDDTVPEVNDEGTAMLETNDAVRSGEDSKHDVNEQDGVGRVHDRLNQDSTQSGKKVPSAPAVDNHGVLSCVPLAKSDISSSKHAKGDQNCYVKESLSESHPNSLVDDTQPPPLVTREPESIDCSAGSRSLQQPTPTEVIESPDFIEETPQQEDPKTHSTDRELVDRSEKVMRQPSFETASQPGHERNDENLRKDSSNANVAGEREEAICVPSADVVISAALPVQSKSAPSDGPETGISLKEVSSLNKPISPSELSEGLKRNAEKEAFGSNPTVEEEDVRKQESVGQYEYGEMRICISGDQKSADYSLVLTLVTMLGGEPVEDFPESCASCVLRLSDAKAKEGSSESGITLGMQHALASGIPILDIQWIIQSFANGTWMEMEGYEIESSKKTREKWPLFKGIVVSFEEPAGKRTFRKQVRQCFDNAANLVTKGGAVLSSIKLISETIEEVGKDNLRLHVHVLNDMDRISDMTQRINDRTKELEQTQSIIPNTVVGSKWVSDCLMNGRCSSLPL